MTINRRDVLKSGLAGIAAAGTPALGQDAAVEITVDTREIAGILPHIWSECAGSDRAAMTLRETWRGDLDRWRDEAGLKRVRFHGIFNDELGVHTPSIVSRGKTDPNFQNIDQVYDGLVARGVAPFVELSFMPAKLASGTSAFGFYKGNISPPKAFEDWGVFIQQFVGHLIARYGRTAVRQWPFEVWNEPNLPFFWSGDQPTYFRLYKATVEAIKRIDPAIKVGGPSTSAGKWVGEFLAWCAANAAPVDFVSTHAYAGDNQKELFGEDLGLPQADVIPEVVRRVRQQIDQSPTPGLPLWLSEWSSDSPAMIAHVISKCLPHCQGMSQWTLSSAFEELGVPDYVLKEGDMGWGMMVHQIAKPSFNTYKLLHRLGGHRLNSSSASLAARDDRGKVSALVWNLADVKQPSGIPGQGAVRTVTGAARRLRVKFQGVRAGQKVDVTFVDQERGSPMPAWRKMGSPQYPTVGQMADLRRAADLASPERRRLDGDGVVTVELPPEGIALLELS